MNEDRTFPDLLRRYLPFLTWGAEYSPRTLASDLVAAAQVAGQGTPEHLGAALFALAGPGRSPPSPPRER